MTVAAVVLVPDAAAALGAVDGASPLRRILDAAWAGGATPVVIVSPDPDGLIRAALEGGWASSDGSTCLRPPRDLPHGIAWFAAGLAEARERVSDTSAALLWPVRHPWVDPETVTSLIEAHGAAPDAILRPAFHGEPGFPALVPERYEGQLAGMPERHGPEALQELVDLGAPLTLVELGDPGTVFDVATPRAELPAYAGPPEPAAGPPPEWNEAIAVRAEDDPA